MIESMMLALLLSVLIAVNFYSRRRLRKRRQQKTQRGIQQLTQLLDLVQRLQRHRGLCANLNDSNRTEQQQLCAEINRYWQPLLDKSYCGNSKRVSLQHDNWKRIEAKPENSFLGHCDLITKLLHELSVIADTCALTADNSRFDTTELWQNLLKRPYFAETLGRIRALGTKAASNGHCSADLRVQLQYQLQNLDKESFDHREVAQIKALVTEQLLTPEQIQIDPRDYFNQVTRAIDNQIQVTREYLQQLS